MNDRTIVTTTVKPWWQSKTILINGVVLLISLVAWISESQGAGILPFNVSPEAIATTLTALNLILRFATSQPITGT